MNFERERRDAPTDKHAIIRGHVDLDSNVALRTVDWRPCKKEPEREREREREKETNRFPSHLFYHSPLAGTADHTVLQGPKVGDFRE